MKIKKIFNNNVVLVEEQQTEMIVMGKGIGYLQGDSKEIDTDKIDKKFVLETNGISDMLGNLLNEIPETHFQVSYKIINLAKKSLNTNLNPTIYVTLTDHISFAITRLEQGLVLNSPLFWEVKKFYEKEYEMAVQALDVIEEDLGVHLPIEEASNIALHFVNAQQSENNMEDTIAVTRMVTDMLNIVKFHYNIELDESSVNFNRFMTHLRYFAYRILSDRFVEEEGDSLFFQVKEKYPAAYLCSQKIVKYLEKNYGKTPTNEELVYFMIHIHRVTNQQLENRK